MLVEIQNDVYFITSRIKEIDMYYKIYFNTNRKVFEIHNSKQIGGSYCLTVPYPLLDKRTVDLVRKTRIENRKNLLKEIDDNNEKLERSKEKKIMDDAKDQFKEFIKYSKY